MKFQNPHTKRILVDKAGIRLDKYLADRFPVLSRSYLQKLIEQGSVHIDGRLCKTGHKLEIGDTISITFPPPQSDILQPEPLPLTIVYEDDDLIVVDKPAGLTVYPAPGHTSHTLVNALLAHYPALSKLDDSVRPGIVHRLDKDTSGLMIVAKNRSAQSHLIAQFKSHRVSKIYLVLVKGTLMPDVGIIEAPIGRDAAHRKRMAVVTDGKQARTRYRVIDHVGVYSLLEVNLETGRTHQIRVHLSAIGFPIVGDTVYGMKSPFITRQFVHSHRLGFFLPSDGEYREFTSDLPEDLTGALEKIRWQ